MTDAPFKIKNSEEWQKVVYENQLNHLEAMAKMDGFHDHSFFMARLMDKAPSGLFAGIAKDLEKCLKKSNEELAKAGD